MSWKFEGGLIKRKKEFLKILYLGMEIVVLLNAVSKLAVNNSSISNLNTLFAEEKSQQLINNLIYATLPYTLYGFWQKNIIVERLDSVWFYLIQNVLTVRISLTGNRVPWLVDPVKLVEDLCYCDYIVKLSP